MGIPYSKQINLAFENVTPLVAAGFKVLERTKNITYLLAAIQVLTAVFLGLILITLLGVIITVSPDLEYERREIVTPVMKWIAGWVLQYSGWFKTSVWIVVIGGALGAAGGWYATREIEVVEVKEGDEEGAAEEGEDGDDAKK